MTRNALHIALVVPSFLLVSPAPAPAQEAGAGTGHVAAARGLLKQLRWHDESSHNQYIATRGDVTKHLMTEIDGFVTESFQPGTSGPDQIKAGLGVLLGYAAMPLMADNNTAFFVTVPKGRFLIACIEAPRGGSAIAEDAISFRAYRDAGSRFVFVSSAEDLHSSDSGNDSLDRLYTKPLTSAPIAGEFWFMALAEVPPQAPPTVAMRLYAFDGEKFRTVWMPKDIRSVGPDKAIECTDGGFIVSSLLDPTGGAALSPTVVVHEQYAVSPDGPHKIAEWRTNRQ